MIDFHVHVGDQALLPSEALRRARLHGYKAVGLVVRADSSTMSQLLPWLLQLSRHYALYSGVEAFAGVELVNVPPPLMPEAVGEARSLGATLVLAHGESMDGVTESGTNLAAIEAGVDILAHPGLLTAEDAALAAERNVLLELTSAPMHSLANAHVAAMAVEYGCGLVFGGNIKGPHDFLTRDIYQGVLRGARITGEALMIFEASQNNLLQRLLKL